MSALGQEAMSAQPPRADMCSTLDDVCYGPIADIPPLHSIGVLEAGPVITNTCAVTLGSLIYQFGEAATKFNIKNLIDALGACAFMRYQMHQRIKLAFQ